jgi:hypothetical protein
LLVTVIIIGLIVAAFIVFGKPRLNRNTARLETLFGSDDRRSASELRDSAAKAFAVGDFDTAIEEIFRALARRLAERTVVRTSPGTTAQDFATRARRRYPEHRNRLAIAARTFDEVRYLGMRGSSESYQQIAALEFELRDLTPVSLEAVPLAVVS